MNKGANQPFLWILPSPGVPRPGQMPPTRAAGKEILTPLQHLSLSTVNAQDLVSLWTPPLPAPGQGSIHPVSWRQTKKVSQVPRGACPLICPSSFPRVLGAAGLGSNQGQAPEIKSGMGRRLTVLRDFKVPVDTHPLPSSFLTAYLSSPPLHQPRPSS